MDKDNTKEYDSYLINLEQYLKNKKVKEQQILNVMQKYGYDRIVAMNFIKLEIKLKERGIKESYIQQLINDYRFDRYDAMMAALDGW